MIGPISFGVTVAIITLVAVFGFRDQIVKVAPGLASALPPKAPLNQKVPAQFPREAPATKPFIELITWEDAQALGNFSMWLGLGVGGLVLPLIAPPILSRRGHLSVGRWLILAGLAFFLLSTLGAFYEAEMRRVANFGVNARTELYIFLAFPCFLSIVGCLLAAALHPKSSP